jgi:hypothetical protein
LILFCTAVSPAQAQTTALYLDSRPGDYVGEGIQYNYAVPHATFQVTRNNKNGVSVAIATAVTSDYWYLDFSAAGDVPLTVGAYESTRRFFQATGNGLSVYGQHRACEPFGRFTVREIVYAADQSIVRFAADFEQLCAGVDGAMFGAVRFNSTIGTLLPFDGAYPVYQLKIAPDAHGRVTASGLDCGSASAICVVSLPSPAPLTLTAVADAGYEFVRWEGDCSGGVTTWIRINSVKNCLAVFEPGFQGTTALYLHSQAGDVIGQGINRTYVPIDGTFDATRNDRNGVSALFRTAAMVAPWYLWSLDFAATADVPLTVGTYLSAREFPWTPLNALKIGTTSHACSRITGRFVVHEVVYRPDGRVHRFAADFEQHCEDAVPALFGAIRYNSTISQVLPFGGNYPSYRLDVSTVGEGRVTGSGIDCSAGAPACQLSSAAAFHVSLAAVPDAGSVFAGWSGDCRGTSTAAVHVNGPKFCAASFEPFTSSAPRSVLYTVSQTGDVIGRGLTSIYNSLSSQWTVRSSDNGNAVAIAVTDSIDRWLLEFTAPDGEALATGYYSAVRKGHFFNQFAGLNVSSTSIGCNDLTGRFVILDIALAQDGSVLRFAADFEQHCADSVPGLFGAIRYNSAAGELRPFAGVYPAYQLSLTPPMGGRVSAIGLSCGGGVSACQVTLPSAAQLALTATPDEGHAFMGWTEDCSGGAMTTLHVNGAKRCGARFEPIQATAPRTVLRWNAQAGHYIGEGRGEVYSSSNSRWQVVASQDNGYVELRIASVGKRDFSQWRLRMAAPAGEQLQAGRRYAGASSSSAPGVAEIGISGNGRGCDGGEFTVHDLAFGSSNALLRFAATFVLHCGVSTGPLLTGAVQYNSDYTLPATTLTADPAALRFAALHNGAAITLQPTPQVVRLTLNQPNARWVATASAPWISVTPTSGIGAGAVTVGLNVAGIAPSSGGASGTVDIMLTDGSGAEREVDIRLTLIHNGLTAAPFGYVDSPREGTNGVTGAIPMTGWALDDVGVTDVTICRVAVADEVPPADPNCAGAAQVYIGHAVFIEGARPDVEAAYGTYPRNNVGGWGFMLLTNMLPNQGNGRFEFSVYARDREGRTTLLGTRAIVCDNARAIHPFGTIDTPGQGELIGGSSYLNFGWALTPSPKHIPTDGSTVMVYVDGVPVGSPSYNHFRPDVAGLFPGLANSDGAVGFKVIDTTALSEGLHTIVWTATDSEGVTAGLGSRYFRVSNGARATAAASPIEAVDSVLAGPGDVPLDVSPIIGRRSWIPDAQWLNYPVGAGGRAVIRGEEIDRFEVALGTLDRGAWTGYLRAGDRRGPLPAGSRLDPDTGAFTWAPGVGFIGTYDVVFILHAGGRQVSRREVRFVLKAKSHGHVGTQVVIDSPRWQQDVAQPFVLSGWAADLDAAVGTGIDVVHVWAYPLAGGAPIFLGTASHGERRPDVAAAHGGQFEASGFALNVQGLVPGHYDLAVFAWSAVSGGFVPASTVRMTAR